MKSFLMPGKLYKVKLEFAGVYGHMGRTNFSKAYVTMKPGSIIMIIKHKISASEYGCADTMTGFCYLTMDGRILYSKYVDTQDPPRHLERLIE